MDYSRLQSILACPYCYASVELQKDCYICQGCRRVFPFRFGIPDFRISPDPYIGIEEEIEKVSSILGNGDYKFTDLVDRYYEKTPEVSPKLQTRYKRGLKAGTARAENFLDQMERTIGPSDLPLLDIGCGTAGLTLVAGKRYGEIVGVDIALRWLVIGRQRLIEAGLLPSLICANAEALPFSKGVFAGVISDSTLEHVTSAERMLKETRRVTRSGGFFYLNTANRYSLMDAYTGFPMAGLFPLRLRWFLIEEIMQTPYKLNPLSVSEIYSLLQDVPDLKIEAYQPLINSFHSTGMLKRALVNMYSKLLGNRLGRRILTHIGFFLSVSGHFQ
jgi:ubiquinone/menaquinone biosynthesis C-methylase UbiE/uncharacterized protein YbaR (Trm112 family)